MVEVNRGVQTIVLKQYEYSRCNQTSVKSISLLGFPQRLLLVLFSETATRLEVISKHTERLSLKKVCETRWENRANSDPLLNHHKETNDLVSLMLIHNMEQFEFIDYLVCDILSRLIKHST